MRMLRLFFSVFGEFRTLPIVLGYELQRFRSFSVDPYGRRYSWNDAEEDRGKKIVFPYVWRSPKLVHAASGLDKECRYEKDRIRASFGSMLTSVNE